MKPISLTVSMEVESRKGQQLWSILFSATKKIQLIQNCANRKDHRHRYSADFCYMHFSFVFFLAARRRHQKPHIWRIQVLKLRIFHDVSFRRRYNRTTNLHSDHLFKTGGSAKRGGCGQNQKTQKCHHQKDQVLDDFDVWIGRVVLGNGNLKAGR